MILLGFDRDSLRLRRVFINSGTAWIAMGAGQSRDSIFFGAVGSGMKPPEYRERTTGSFSTVASWSGVEETDCGVEQWILRTFVCPKNRVLYLISNKWFEFTSH
jgi:hypothetical protein